MMTLKLLARLLLRSIVTKHTATSRERLSSSRIRVLGGCYGEFWDPNCIEQVANVDLPPYQLFTK